MFVEKKNTPLSSLKSSVGATCFGGRFLIAGDTHAAPIIVPYGNESLTETQSGCSVM
jgi:hypothetical protein